MYSEDSISKNLMKINALHKDISHINGKKEYIINFLNKISEFLGILLSFIFFFKHGWSKSFIRLKCFIFPKLYKDHDLPYSFEHQDEINYSFKGKYNGEKIAVYSAVYGAYDTIKEPLYISENCDYYIFTDAKIPHDSIWKKMDDKLIPGFEEMDNYHRAKLCKIMPHLFFKEYKYSLWVDGNVQIVADIVPLVDRVDINSVMATFNNPLHDCIYTEKNFLICKNAVDIKKINEQIGIYKKQGFPKHFGMREFSIILRQHNNEGLICLMEQWWKEVINYTMRDQISFPYLLWKNNYEIDYIELLGENWRDNPRFVYYNHSWRLEF